VPVADRVDALLSCSDDLIRIKSQPEAEPAVLAQNITLGCGLRRQGHGSGILSGGFGGITRSDHCCDNDLNSC